MKLFIDIFMKRIYLFNIVAWNYRKKIGFPVCKKENIAGLQAHRKRGKSARASPTPRASLIKWRAKRSFHRPTFIRPVPQGVNTRQNKQFQLSSCSCADGFEDVRTESFSKVVVKVLDQKSIKAIQT